jgi:hypothetical protein
MVISLLQMIIVGLKPSPQTQYKYVKPKSPTHFHHNAIAAKLSSEDQPTATAENTSESLSGCLAWLPVMKLGGVRPNANGKGMNILAVLELSLCSI